MFYQVTEDENHNKQLTCLAGQVPGNGCPLGSILPYYGTAMPSRNWLLCDGSTFDADEYPALYAFLGSNTLPDLRNKTVFGVSPTGDLTTVGDTTNGKLPNITGRSTYYITGGDYMVSNQNSGAFVNDGGASGGYPQREASWSSETQGVHFDASNSNSIYTDSHDLVTPASVGINWIIKATSSIDTETSDNVYATIREEDKYKTTEVNTGKTWIDGKPIYRIVHKFWENGVVSSDFSLSGQIFTKISGNITDNADEIISIKTVFTETNGHKGEQHSSNPGSGIGTIWISNNSFYNNIGVTCESEYLIIEYTKTTD